MPDFSFKMHQIQAHSAPPDSLAGLGEWEKEMEGEGKRRGREGDRKGRREKDGVREEEEGGKGREGEGRGGKGGLRTPYRGDRRP